MTSSYVQMDCIIKARVGNPREKLALIALASFANHEGTCWPSREALAARIECSVATVKRLLNSLIQKGFIEIIHRHNRTNFYKLALPAIQAADLTAQNEPPEQTEADEFGGLCGSQLTRTTNLEVNLTAQNEHLGAQNEPLTAQNEPLCGSQLTHKPDQRTKTNNQTNEPKQIGVAAPLSPSAPAPASASISLGALTQVVNDLVNASLTPLVAQITQLGQLLKSGARKSSASSRAPRTQSGNSRERVSAEEIRQSVLALGVKESTYNDWLAMRESKGAKLYAGIANAIKRMTEDVQQTYPEMGSDELLSYYTLRGWVGFDAVYYTDARRREERKNHAEKSSATKEEPKRERNFDGTSDYYLIDPNTDNWFAQKVLATHPHLNRETVMKKREAEKAAQLAAQAAGQPQPEPQPQPPRPRIGTALEVFGL